MRVVVFSQDPNKLTRELVIAEIGQRIGQRSLEEGIREVKEAIESGLIQDPFSPRYRNHQFIVN